MNIHLTSIPRQPLVTKATQIYSGSDRQQRQLEWNNNKSLAKQDAPSTASTFDIYGYNYEIVEHHTRVIDIKI